MANLSISQVKQIVQNAPPGSNPQEVVQALVANGHSLEGLSEMGSPMEGFSNATNEIYGNYKGALDMTGIPQAIGAGVGAVGGAIGGVVGAIGNPIANAIEGKPLFQNWGEDVANTAASTAGFGYDIGHEGAPAATLGTFGTVPNAALAASQAYQGYKDLKYGSGDPARQFQGALELGTGAVGVKNAVSSLGQVAKTGDGLFLNPSVKAGIEQTVPGSKYVLSPVDNIVKPAVQKMAAPFQDALVKSAENQFAAIANQTATKQALDVKKGKTPVQEVLAQEQLRGTDLAGLPKDQAAANLTDKINELERTTIQPALDNSPGSLSWEAIRAEWLARAQRELADRGPDYLKAVDQINNTVDAFKTSSGSDSVSFGQANSIKSKYFWGKAFNPSGTPTSNDVAHLGGQVLNDMIEEAVPDQSVKAMHAYEGDLIRARDALQSSVGKVVGGGRLSRLAGSGIASMLATSPLGKLAWALGGDQFVKQINSPEARGMIAGGLLNLSGAQPKALDFSKRASQLNSLK
jgi:hypothetical protein